MYANINDYHKMISLFEYYKGDLSKEKKDNIEIQKAWDIGRFHHTNLAAYINQEIKELLNSIDTKDRYINTL